MRTASWSGARGRFAVLAVVTAAVTGSLLSALGGAGVLGYRSAAYLAVTGLALFAPAAITAQVIGGVALAGAAVLGPAAAVLGPSAAGLGGPGAGLLSLVPAVAGITLGAELLAVVARLDTPVHREPERALRGASVAALLAAGVYGAVAIVAQGPGFGGLLAVATAAGACLLLALRLAR